MKELLIAVTGFIAMGAICSLLEFLWPENSRQPRWRPDSWIDVFYTTLRIVLSAGLVFLTWLTGHTIPEGAPHLAGKQPFWLQFAEVLLLSDLISYWVHRAMHHSYSLWRIHTIHHSAQQVDWLVAARVHPFELVIQKVVQSLPLYLLGFSPHVFAVTVPLVATYSLFLHANLGWTYGPLRFLIASPAYHRWHHSADPEIRDKNLAQVFPVFDWLFGTFHLPRQGHPVAYGLNGFPFPTSIWQHLIYPLPARLRHWLERLGTSATRILRVSPATIAADDGIEGELPRFAVAADSSGSHDQGSTACAEPKTGIVASANAELAFPCDATD